MDLSDVMTHLLRETVERMPDRFATKDVSEHPDMLVGHVAARDDSNYHSMVGRALSLLVDRGGNHTLSEIQKKTRRGSIWRKTASEIGPPCGQQDTAGESRRVGTDPTTTTLAVEEMDEDAEDRTGLGPQHPGDSAFAARMRRHQSWYRSSVLKVTYGQGPKRNDTDYRGSMLTRKDGAEGLNFLTPEIFAVVQCRLAQGGRGVEPFRLLHNMLSSQPMCFNLLGPLVNDMGLATRLFKRVLPDEVGEVTRVAIEYAPKPASEYLDDLTAFDAFIEYRTTSGAPAFIGIETKLTETFSQKHKDGPAYRRWMEWVDTVWRDSAWDQVDDGKHNQLWRDHLLAVALLNHPRSPYRTGRFMLVRHPEDTECASVTTGYRELLKPVDRTFVDMPLDKLVALFGCENLTASQKSWLEAFRLRYLALDASENE